MDFFHIYNRGVDKRTVFIDNQDYARFQRNLYVLNTTESYSHTEASIVSRARKQQKDPLVNIHAFALMPNHYHLLISEMVAGGISVFMKKINMGYSKYFNERYERTGSLWQGKYKSVLIDKQAQFAYIPYYIHLNPLDLHYPEWRHANVRNHSAALKKLNSYQWCSHYHFMNPELLKFSPVVNSFYIDKFRNQAAYLKQIEKIITSPRIAQDSNDIEL